MKTVPTITKFRGKDVAEMTREELLEVIGWCGFQLAAAQNRYESLAELFRASIRRRAA